MLFTVTDGPRAQQPLLLLQSSSSQSTIPILRQILNHNVTKATAARSILFCVLYDPSSLVDDPCSERLVVHNWQSHVPGYDPDDQWSTSDTQEKIISTLKDSSAGPLDLVIDSINTLCSDIGSVSETCQFLRRLVYLVRERPGAYYPLSQQTSRPTPTSRPLEADPPCGTTIAPRISINPDSILPIPHTRYCAPTCAPNPSLPGIPDPPPPASPEAKFWGVFLPVSERLYETDRIVYGPAGDGCGGTTEFVIEILVRGADGRKRAVERVLQGWSTARGGSCELAELQSLKGLQSAKPTNELPPDPTQNISFNLSLTAAQQESRAQVPLPYAHEGKSIPHTGAIFYDPDSADDIDDDDPDEDLDI
ncbi:hypothetical protein BD779DRAFT_1666485 [Infundibulicybe gibba]|nr:hypothetical protein BD779DRAFT_1666485 [Infundibulicybe gibba]